jgi:hypothetical protein
MRRRSSASSRPCVALEARALLPNGSKPVGKSGDGLHETCLVVSSKRGLGHALWRARVRVGALVTLHDNDLYHSFPVYVFLSERDDWHPMSIFFSLA